MSTQSETDNLLRERVYQNTLKIMTTAKDEIAYRSAADSFESLGDYKDAPQLYKECDEQAKRYHNGSVYNAAKAAIEANAAKTYQDANKLKQQITLLQTILGWKDSETLIAQCHQKIEEIQLREEEYLREAQKKAAAQRLAAAKAARIRKIILTIVALLVVIGTTIFLLNKYVWIPNQQYDAAMAHVQAGELVDGYNELLALDGYKDTAEQAAAIYEDYKAQLLQTAEIGETVLFGSYQLEALLNAEDKDLEWIVLDKKDGKVLLLSVQGLHGSKFHDTETETTWETSWVRTWLNNEFYNDAFDAADQAQIVTTTVSADANPKYDTNQGGDTLDQVFLLSINEVNTYFTDPAAAKCEPTTYAISTGTYINYDIGYCDWWLRTMGSDTQSVSSVNTGGIINYQGSKVDFGKFSLRPAIWVDPAN